MLRKTSHVATEVELKDAGLKKQQVTLRQRKVIVLP
jgi:hypothetical protein